MRSEFAEALRILIEDSNIFNKAEWAKLFGVSEHSIHNWLNDVEIPKPSRLNLLFIIIDESSDIPDEIAEKFKTMAHKPARKVSPFGKRMLPTVWRYMKRPAFDEESNILAKLSPEEQERYLEEKYPPPEEICYDRVKIG